MPQLVLHWEAPIDPEFRPEASMSVRRGDVVVADASRWVFNRMADVYAARPAYPAALIDALAALATPVGPRIGDIGAGIGHVALRLSARGFDVTAVEPALAMLAELRREALGLGLTVRTVQGAAEALPLDGASLDVAIVADALHFMNAERTAGELARVLGKKRALGVVTCEFAETPFMRAVREVMTDAAQRKPRDVTPAVAQVFAVVGVPVTSVRRFHDETPVLPDALEKILRSISFIGPAMNPTRFAAFRERIHSLGDAPIWARTFTLHAGNRMRAGR